MLPLLPWVPIRIPTVAGWILFVDVCRSWMSTAQMARGFPWISRMFPTWFCIFQIQSHWVGSSDAGGGSPENMGKLGWKLWPQSMRYHAASWPSFVVTSPNLKNIVIWYNMNLYYILWYESWAWSSFSETVAAAILRWRTQCPMQHGPLSFMTCLKLRFKSAPVARWHDLDSLASQNSIKIA